MRHANLPEVKQRLADGATVRYEWSINLHYLITDGKPETIRFIDGRTYHAFVYHVAPKLIRRETGTTEQNNLIIEWSIK